MGYKISFKLCQVVLMRQIILFQAKRGKNFRFRGFKMPVSTVLSLCVFILNTAHSNV